MPTFDIQTPSGKILTIEAADEAAAMRGAQQWHSEQTAPKPKEDGFSSRALAFISGMTSGALGNLADWGGASMVGTQLPMIEAMTGQKMPDTTELARASIAARKKMAEENPGTTLAGRITGGVGAGLMASPVLGYTAPASAGAAPAAWSVASYLLRNAGFGAAMGATEGSNPNEIAQNAGVGALVGGAGAAVAPAIGRLAQGLYNTGVSGVNAVRQMATTQGRQGVAGQILREASEIGGGVPASSSITELRPAQITGNRGLASLERTLAPPGVSNGMTAGQADDVLRALPGYAEGATTDLLANNSRSGVAAIQAAESVLDAHASKLWNDPVLSSVRMNGDAIKQAGHGVIDNMPASWRAAFDSAEGAPLAPFRKEITELPTNPSVKDVNAIVSNLRKVARNAASGPQPNDVVASAANRAADGLLDAMRADTAIVGRSANPGIPIVGAHSGKPFYDANGIPLVSGETFGQAPRPDVMTAFDAARAATRTQHELLGYNEFGGILNPNRQGNVQADASQAFGRFFTGDGGEGATRLSNLVGRLRGLDTPEAKAAADAIETAAKDRVGLQIAHAGRPRGLPGETQAAMGAVEREAGSAAPWVARNPMLRDISPQIDEVRNTAAALMRPARSRGDTNSTTFEKMQQNALISSILGQTGASGLTAPLGAAAAYQWGPDAVPAPARIAAGFAGGALGGKAITPGMVNALMNKPILRGSQEQVETAVRRELIKALENPKAFREMVERELYRMPGFSEAGRASDVGLALGPTTAALLLDYNKRRNANSASK